MPALADVDCRVHVAQMVRSAIRAIPFPLIQTCLTFRPGNATAFVAGLGTPSFVDFREQHLRLMAFVLKHRSERRPASVQDGLRHLGFCQAGRVHVADEDCPVLVNEACRNLVQVILAAVGNLGVNSLHPLLVVRALRYRKRWLKVAVETLRLDGFSIRHNCEALQAEIDADRRRTSALDARNLNRAVDVPVTFGILIEAACADPRAIRKLTRQPHVVPLLAKHKGAIFERDVAGVERDPSEGLPATPFQAALLVCAPGFFVLHAHALHRVRVQVQHGCCASRKATKIVPAGPFLAPLQGVLLRFVTEIPAQIDRARLPIQLGCMLVFHPELVSNKHIVDHITNT